MDGAQSNVEALGFLLLKEPNGNLERGLVFFDSIDDVMNAHRWFTSKLPPEMAARVGIYHSRRGEMSKGHVYEEFCKGNLDVLFCTEAAGMVRTTYRVPYRTTLIYTHEQGCDMPDLTFVVQFLVPGSLSVWFQRAGRVARRLNSHGQVYLLVQPSVHQEKNKNQRDKDDDIEYVKEIEEAMR